MPPFKVFVSHVWRRHHEYYWGLIRLLDDASRFSFVDLSVPKIRPFDGTDWSDVQDEILVLLRSADVVLTINTPAITRSKAVREELTEAEKCGIPIIAIACPNAEAEVGRRCLVQCSVQRRPIGRRGVSLLQSARQAGVVRCPLWPLRATKARPRLPSHWLMLRLTRSGAMTKRLIRQCFRGTFGRFW